MWGVLFLASFALLVCEHNNFSLLLFTIPHMVLKTTINLIIDENSLFLFFSMINIDAVNFRIHSEYKYVFLLSLYLGAEVINERYTLP